MEFLMEGVSLLTWKQLVMYAVGIALIELEITWKGMAGLFAAAALIWFCIWIMGKIGQKK